VFNKLECLSLASLFKPSAMYHFSLLAPFVSYEENDVL
jgi:hypothetical protein